MKNLSLWAQSLDNQSPDVIFKDGKELSDDKLRQQLVLEIYEIPKNKMEILSVDSAVTIRYSDPKFLIEAIPAEKDQANRLAPVIIYGELPDNSSELWIKDVCTEIEDFVSDRLKRTLDNSALLAIRDWLNETLEKKEGGFTEQQLKFGHTFPIPLSKLVKEGGQALQKILGEVGSQKPDYRNRVRNMTLNEVPPKKRKAILVISPHELTRLEYTPEGSELLLSEQVYLLVPSEEVTSSLEEKLDSSGLLEPGTLLIQNPYDTSDYVVLDRASSTFALTKDLHFTTLCGLLGAREVTVEQIEVKTLTGKQVFKGSLSSPCVDGKIEGVNRTFEEMRNNIKLQSKFGGGEPNLDEAEAHLHQYQLSNNISMKSLIDQRKGRNPIKSRELTLSLSEESKKNFKAISDIKVPVYANLQTRIEQVRKEVYKFTLTVKVEF